MQGEVARIEDALQLLRARLLPGQQLDLTNLQLSLVQRDFTGSDYDALLALDDHRAPAPGQTVSDKCIKALPTFIHQRCESQHCVCLEVFPYVACYDNVSKGTGTQHIWLDMMIG